MLSPSQMPCPLFVIALFSTTAPWDERAMPSVLSWIRLLKIRCFPPDVRIPSPALYLMVLFSISGDAEKFMIAAPPNSSAPPSWLFPAYSMIQCLRTEPAEAVSSQSRLVSMNAMHPQGLAGSLAVKRIGFSSLPTAFNAPSTRI